MKSTLLHRALKFYLGFTILFIAFVSCSDDENGIHVSWTYIGVRHVEVDFIDAPDTVQFTDTLELYMCGDVADVDLPLFSYVEEARWQFQVDLKLWAKA